MEWSEKAICPECGFNHEQDVLQRSTEQDRLTVYRRALLLACNNDNEAFLSYLRKAEDILWTQQD
jgi:hypothetical protein